MYDMYGPQVWEIWGEPKKPVKPLRLFPELVSVQLGIIARPREDDPLANIRDAVADALQIMSHPQEVGSPGGHGRVLNHDREKLLE